MSEVGNQNSFLQAVSNEVQKKQADWKQDKGDWGVYVIKRDYPAESGEKTTKVFIKAMPKRFAPDNAVEITPERLDKSNTGDAPLREATKASLQLLKNKDISIITKLKHKVVKTVSHLANKFISPKTVTQMIQHQEIAAPKMQYLVGGSSKSFTPKTTGGGKKSKVFQKMTKPSSKNDKANFKKEMRKELFSKAFKNDHEISMHVHTPPSTTDYDQQHVQAGKDLQITTTAKPFMAPGEPDSGTMLIYGQQIIGGDDGGDKMANEEIFFECSPDLSALAAQGKEEGTDIPTLRSGSGMQDSMVGGGQSSAVYLQNIRMLAEIDTQKEFIAPDRTKYPSLYGGNFAKAAKKFKSEKAFVKALQDQGVLKKLDQPKTVDVLYQVAPYSMAKTKVSKEQVGEFVSILEQSYLQRKQEGGEIGEGKALPAGFLGCGAFNGNKTMCALCHMAAAKMADVPIHFHLGINEADAAENKPHFEAAKKIFDEQVSAKIDELVANGGTKGDLIDFIYDLTKELGNAGFASLD